MKKRKAGRFLVFDGPDGCGKSTQIPRVKRFLQRNGIRVIVARDPGGTPIGRRIRKILLSPLHEEMNDDTELFLYLASRAQLVEEVIRPALASGHWVIADRFYTATLAYQGYGNGLSPAKLRELEALCRRSARGLLPDRVYLLDLPPEEGLARRSKRDRIEGKKLAYHRRVRRGFLKQAKQDPKRFHVTDARLPKDAITRDLRADLNRFL